MPDPAFVLPGQVIQALSLGASGRLPARKSGLTPAKAVAFAEGPRRVVHCFHTCVGLSCFEKNVSPWPQHSSVRLVDESLRFH